MRYYNNYMDEMYSTTSTFGRKIPQEYHKLSGYMEDKGYIKDFNPYPEIPKDRSVVNRALGVLNVGQFAVAGFATGFVDEDVNPIQGLLQGVWAANPLSNKSDWQYSFSGVLDKAGWQPDTTGGKIAKGAVGMGLDILLDPMTYVSGGAMGVVKGTGASAAKTATGASNIVDLLGDSAKFVDDIDGLTKAGRMTQDVAEAVVRNSKLFKSGIDTVNVAEDATRLMNKFNDLIGIYDKSADVTLSLANAPFGKKIFGKHADKSLTLIDSDVVKAFGDKTLAPAYGALRNQVYGSKIGELFAPDHILYKFGKSDPTYVYDAMKYLDMKKGLGVDKLKMADIIRKEGSKLSNLTPKQQEEVISAMENKTIQHKVKKLLRFSETEEAMEYTDKIRQAKKHTEDKIDDLLNQYEEMGVKIETSKSNVKANKQTAEHIRKKQIEDLMNLDERYVNMSSKEKAEQINNMMKETADSINPKKDGEKVVNTWKEHKKAYEQAKIDDEAYKTLHDAMKPKTDVDVGLGQKPGEVLLDEAARTKIDKLVKPDTVSGRTWRRRFAELKKNGYMEYTRRKASDTMLEKLGEGWLRSELPNGVTRLYPPGFDDYVKVSSEVLEKTTPKTIRMDAIDEISEYIYGQKGMISYDTYESRIDKIVDMIERGRDPEEMHYVIMQTRQFYNGVATPKYSYIAGKVGYGGNTGNGNWGEYYTDGMHNLLEKDIKRRKWETNISDLKEDIAKKTEQLRLEKLDAKKTIDIPFEEQIIDVRSLTTKPNTSTTAEELKSLKDKFRNLQLKKNTPEALTKENLDMITTLQQKNLQREVLLHQFKDADTAQKVQEVLTKIADAEIDEFVTRNYDDYIAEVARGEFNINDFMDKHTNGIKRQYHKTDPKGEIFKLHPNEKEQLINHFNNQDVLDNYNTIKYKKSPKQSDALKKSDELLASVKAKREELSKLYKTKDADPKEISRLKAEISRDTMRGQNLKNKVLDELADQKIKPTADNIIDYYDANPDVQKTTAQIKNINDSKKLTDEIERLKQQIRDFRQMQSATDKPIIKTSVDDVDMDIVGAEYLYNKQLDDKKISKMEEKLAGLITQRKNLNEKLADSLTNFKYEPSLYDMRRYDGISVEVEKVLAQRGKEFSKLSEEDLANVYKVAEWNYEKTIGVETGADKKKLYETAKKELDKRLKAKAEVAKEVVEKKPIKNIDDLAYSSESYGEFIARQRDLDKVVLPKEEVLKGLSPELLAEKQIEIDKINDRYNKILSGIEESTMNLEDTISELEEAYKNFDTKQVEDLATKVKEYEEVLNSADAFETYVSSVPGGEKHMEEVLKRYNSDAGKYILNEDLDISNESKEAIEFLRNKFREMGHSEVDIGKLNKGQIKANEFDYLPHMLTDEGKKLFANKDIQKKMQGFGDASGFGREFNEFAKSRKFKVIPDGHGGWINKPTIVELNDFFREMAGGKDVFSTDVSELYISRALKHNDLMYDAMYMENMVDIFGEAYDGVLKEGYSVAINYGKLKQTTQTVARGHQSLDISDAISRYMSDPSVRNMISRETEKRIADLGLGHDAWKKVNNEVATEFIKRFMENNITDEVRDAMYKGRLGAFVQDTGTGKMLDELAVPLGHLDDDQISAMNNSVSALKTRYEKHIRKRFGSFMSKNLESKGVVIDGLSVDEMKDMLNKALSGADEIDTDRITRILNRIDEYSKIEAPQVGQINSSIFEKANMARKLQIQRDQSKFLTMYDKITHFIKVNQTAILPGFHARNMSSNKFQSALGVGVDALDPEMTMDAFKAMQFAEGKDGVDKVISFLNKDGNEVSMKMSELYQAAKDYGAIDEGFFAKDLGTAGGEGLLSKFGVKGKFDPTNMDEFIPYVKGTEIGSTIENHDRFIHFISRVKSGDSFHDAAESVNKFLFDYSDLTGFEQSVMKRIFPYYTWLRKNAPLQLEMMLERPEVYRNISKVLGGIEGMVNEEDKIDKRFVNDFAQDWIQTPFFTTNEDGREEPVLMKPDLPYMDLNDIPNPFDPKGTVANLVSQANPMLKLPVEFAMNKNMFFDSPIAKRYDKDYYKPSESIPKKYLEHAGNQFGIVPLARGIANKTGADFGFHILNNTSGIKMMSYDYDKYKAMKLSTLNKKKRNTKSNPGIIDSINRRLGGY